MHTLSFTPRLEGGLARGHHSSRQHHPEEAKIQRRISNGLPSARSRVLPDAAITTAQSNYEGIVV